MGGARLRLRFGCVLRSAGSARARAHAAPTLPLPRARRRPRPPPKPSPWTPRPQAVLRLRREDERGRRVLRRRGGAVPGPAFLRLCGRPRGAGRRARADGRHDGPRHGAHGRQRGHQPQTLPHSPFCPSMGAAVRTRPVQRRWAAAGCSLSPARPAALPPLRLQAPSMLSIFGTRHDGTSDAMRPFGGLAARWACAMYTTTRSRT